MILREFLFLMLSLAIVRCVISRFLSFSSVPVCYVQITSVEEKLGVFEPQGGVRDDV